MSITAGGEGATGRVGFAGMGIMGARMAANLRRAGYELTVWNRTAGKARAWATEHGAEVADTPAALGRDCDLVVTMVVDGPQVAAVLTGEDGVATDPRPGLLCIDMSTIGRGWARRIGSSLAERGVRFIDAPVTGSSPKAEDGTLTIMAGGEAADFARARPLFDAMGELIVHVGPLGDGQMVKLINNAVAATNAAVVGEALLLGHRSGVDLDALLKVMGAGAGGSAMLDLKARPMIERDYSTLFKLEHMLKDLRLCLDEARESGAAEPEFFAEVERILAEAERLGYGEQDFAALIEALAERSGTRL